MRILQLCNKPPFPPMDGASIAMYNLNRGLRELGHTVHILAMNTHKQYCNIEEVPADFRKETNYTLVDIDIRIKLLPAFFNLFTSQSYNIIRFDTAEVRKKLRAILEANRYDCVILESLFASTYIDLIRKYSDAKVVLRSHNVEFNIWENLARNEASFLKRKYLELLSRRLKKYELQTLSKVDFVGTISEPDREKFQSLGCRTPMAHIPFGMDFREGIFKHHAIPTAEEMALFHVGSMDWIPHQEAFRWFLTQVWPTFHQQYPSIQLHLAGANMPDWLNAENYPGVIVTRGFVDGKKFMEGKTIMVVPSFSGSGIRIKIAEGMAKGKVILTTANGAMGIPCTHGENIFISEDPQKWVAILGKCVSDLALVHSISQNAKVFAEEAFDYVKSAEKLVQFIS